MRAICKMSKLPTTWPCAAPACPLFGDCIVEYQRKEAIRDQVAWYNQRHGRLVLTDGTEIINAYKIGRLEGWVIDQVILADDRRLNIKEHHRGFIGSLMAHRKASIIPEEFALQIYDIDEEV